MSTSVSNVVIVGAGPAGLSAALQLKQCGVTHVQVIDREETPGGNPRLCHHTGFGRRDLRRIYNGPDYAQEYVRRAERAGIEMRTSTSVTGWANSNTLTLTSPQGVSQLSANAILLATGCRERPRSARLIPGSRPQGVFTTGSLQRFVHQYGQPVGRKAVVVGAELISLSTVMTLAHTGIQIARVVTELPRDQIYFPYSIARWVMLNWHQRVSISPGYRVSQILGHRRVEAVELTHLLSGETELVECDTIIFTGSWIPNHELVRLGTLVLDPATRGPQIDASFRTSRSGVFAAGNLLRGAETADIAALEGQFAARSIHQFLEQGTWAKQTVAVQVSEAIAWIYPNSISFPSSSPQSQPFSFRVNQFYHNVEIQVRQGDQLLYHQWFSRLRPNESAQLEAKWVSAVCPTGNVQVMLVNPKKE